eukprot:COSAG02_NODE_1690_length_11299_cov_21.781071_9_plen_34_part_00
MYMLFCGLVLIKGLPDNHTMMTANATMTIRILQ